MLRERFPTQAVRVLENPVALRAVEQGFEVYTPNGWWAAAAPMTTARASFTLTSLTNGKVLAVGGKNANASALATAEFYSL